MKKKQALIFGFGQQEEAVCQILLAHGVAPRVVSPEEVEEKIGALCGLPGYKSHPRGEQVPAGSRALMVFDNLEQEELDRVLKAMKDIPVRSVKAMVTPTNRNWTLLSLLKAVQEEQQVMGALIKLQQLRAQVPMPDPRNIPLMKAWVQAGALLSGQQEVTLQQVHAVRDALVKAAGL